MVPTPFPPCTLIPSRVETLARVTFQASRSLKCSWNKVAFRPGHALHVPPTHPPPPVFPVGRLSSRSPFQELSEVGTTDARVPRLGLGGSQAGQLLHAGGCCSSGGACRDVRCGEHPVRFRGAGWRGRRGCRLRGEQRCHRSLQGRVGAGLAKGTPPSFSPPPQLEDGSGLHGEGSRRVVMASSSRLLWRE